jgi:hypothetical protein
MLDGGRSDFVSDELDIAWESGSSIGFSFDIELRLRQTRQIAEAGMAETKSKEPTENRIYILVESTSGLWISTEPGLISCGNKSFVHCI